MSKRVWWGVILMLTMVLVAACEGGTSGSVTGSRRSCKSRLASGKCTGGYRKLRGTYSEDIENSRIFLDTPVQVEISTSVEAGTVKVWVKAPGDETLSAIAKPGQPVTLKGTAAGLGDEFRVYFEAGEEEASGVSFEITYEIP